MRIQQTILSDFPRVSRLYPRVIRIGCMEEVVFCRERILEDYQFCFQLHGSGDATVVNIDGRDFQADFPRILIKRKGEVHKIDTPGQVSSFYFVYPPEAPFREWIPDDLVLFPMEFTPAMQQLHRKIVDLMASPLKPGSCDHLDRYCWEFMHEVLLTRALDQGSPEHLPEKLVRILSYLQLHFTEEIDYQQLATSFGYSVRTLNRHWRKIRQDTPVEYVTRLRLQEARRLLRETPYTIEEIARRVHFKQSAYLIRRFKEYTGMTPRQYRFSPAKHPE